MIPVACQWFTFYTLPWTDRNGTGTLVVKKREKIEEKINMNDSLAPMVSGFMNRLVFLVSTQKKYFDYALSYVGVDGLIVSKDGFTIGLCLFLTSLIFYLLFGGLFFLVDVIKPEFMMKRRLQKDNKQNANRNVKNMVSVLGSILLFEATVVLPSSIFFSGPAAQYSGMKILEIPTWSRLIIDITASALINDFCMFVKMNHFYFSCLFWASFYFASS